MDAAVFVLAMNNAQKIATVLGANVAIGRVRRNATKRHALVFETA